MNGWGVSTWYTGPVPVPVAETASVFTPLLPVRSSNE